MDVFVVMRRFIDAAADEVNLTLLQQFAQGNAEAN